MAYKDNVVEFPTSLPDPRPNMFVALAGFIFVTVIMVSFVLLAISYVPNWFVGKTKISFDTLQIGVMACVGPIAANILIVVYAEWWKFVCHRA